MAADVLMCDVRRGPALALVTVRGHLDVSTAPVLRSAVYKALTTEPAAVLIDLSGVTGTDQIALTVFLSLAQAAAAWPGTQLVNHSAGPALARALGELGVDRQVPLAADRAAAQTVVDRGPGPVMVRWGVYGGGEGLAETRDILRDFCLRHGLHVVSGNAELLITELVGNAIVHGTGPITVQASLRRRYLHLAVQDRSPALPRLVGPDGVSGAGGRGLMIVEGLSLAWGAMPVPPGKVVWCTLRP